MNSRVQNYQISQEDEYVTPNSSCSSAPRSLKRRTPNGYAERNTTMRFVDKKTARLMGTKQSRVLKTQAAVRNGAALCTDFLDGNCEAGSSCPDIHVPAQYLWELLLPAIRRTTLLYEKGFSFRCYSFDETRNYEIPSEFVYVTKGSRDYIELFNESGDNMRSKKKLCRALTLNHSCPLNGSCDDIHCCTDDLSQFNYMETHIARADCLQGYRHLPDNMEVRALLPNGGESRVYSGGRVLQTAGALLYETAYRNHDGIPSIKMEHCAHFQTNKMCRLGYSCRFLHVVTDELLGDPAPSPAAVAAPAGVHQRNKHSSAAANMFLLSGDQQSTPGTPALNTAAAVAATAAQQQQQQRGTPVSRLSPGGQVSSGRVSPSYRNNPYSLTGSRDITGGSM